MPSDYEEQIALQGTLISRPESPALEGAAAEAIEEAFRDLIERRYLYQKLTVDLGRVDADANSEEGRVAPSLKYSRIATQFFQIMRN
jgi:hypothetical protein